MTLHVCPRCQQVFVAMPGTSDFVHDCNSGNDVLDQEDVPVIGGWEDYTGSGGVSLPTWQGLQNELIGTRAGIDGENKEELTIRGNKKATHRIRDHSEFIELQ